jgi:signal recognition particle subunit SRP54
MQQLKNMGSMKKMLGMLPGMGQMREAIENFDEREVDRVEAMIRSMTPAERDNPKIINGSRRARIAAGSGTQVSDVNGLLERFTAAQKMMQQMAKGGGMPVPGMGNLPGMGKKGRGRTVAPAKKVKGKSGNPAKRAAQERAAADRAAGIAPAAPAAAKGSSFGLGGGAPRQDDAFDPSSIEDLQKFLGR